MIDSKVLKIEFCLFDFTNPGNENPPCIAELSSKFDSHNFSSLFENNENFLGEIKISYKGVTTSINDNIYGLVRNMCFRSINNLILKEEVKLMYFTTYGYINLIPNGNEILIIGNHFESIKLPFREFVREIYQMGKRFTSLFEKTANNNEENKNLLEILKSDEMAAAIQLEKTL